MDINHSGLSHLPGSLSRSGSPDPAGSTFAGPLSAPGVPSPSSHFPCPARLTCWLLSPDLLTSLLWAAGTCSPGQLCPVRPCSPQELTVTPTELTAPSWWDTDSSLCGRATQPAEVHAPPSRVSIPFPRRRGQSLGSQQILGSFPGTFTAWDDLSDSWGRLTRTGHGWRVNTGWVWVTL